MSDDEKIPTLLDYAKVIEWLWTERHDLSGPHRNGVHMSDFPAGLDRLFEDALRRVQLAKERDRLVARLETDPYAAIRCDEFPANPGPGNLAMKDDQLFCWSPGGGWCEVPPHTFGQPA